MRTSVHNGQTRCALLRIVRQCAMCLSICLHVRTDACAKCHIVPHHVKSCRIGRTVRKSSVPCVSPCVLLSISDRMLNNKPSIKFNNSSCNHSSNNNSCHSSSSSHKRNNCSKDNSKP